LEQARRNSCSYEIRHKNYCSLPIAYGVMDEGIQLFIPNRVFDSTDIIFNGFANLFAIGGNVVLEYSRRNRKKG